MRSQDCHSQTLNSKHDQKFSATHSGSYSRAEGSLPANDTQFEFWIEARSSSFDPLVTLSSVKLWLCNHGMEGKEVKGKLGKLNDNEARPLAQESKSRRVIMYSV